MFVKKHLDWILISLVFTVLIGTCSYYDYFASRREIKFTIELTECKTNNKRTIVVFGDEQTKFDINTRNTKVPYLTKRDYTLLGG